MYEKRKGLWIALHEGGIVTEEPKLNENDDTQMSNDRLNQNSNASQGTELDVDYTFDFGKFSGCKWFDVDKGYRDWIVKTKDVWQKRNDLWSALYKAGIVKVAPEGEQE